MDPKNHIVIIFILLLMLMPVFADAQAFQALPADSEIKFPVPDSGLGLSDTILILTEEENGLLPEDPADDVFCLADEKPEVQNCGTDDVLSISGEQSDNAVIGTDPELTDGSVMDYIMPNLNGEEIHLGGIISENQVTMLNIWGISCAPCLKEIPHLVDLREQYKDRGFEIVGLTSDLLDPNGETDPDLEEEAKEIVTELDVTYPVLVLTGEIRKQMQIIATPTTVFVNDKGQVIGDVIMGTRSGDEWDRMIRDILDQPEHR